MGAGIAQVAAQSGCDVLLNDRSRELFDRGVAGIDKNLTRAVERERITAVQRVEALARIAFAPAIAKLDVDIAIEAATENLALKCDLFGALDAATPPAAILASNTSSISITTLGAATKRAEKTIGMHFMNPVPVMKLVEVIRGVATSDETYAATAELARTMGKIAVEVRDFPGFVANRVLMPMINEAIYALFEGVGTAESIDTVMKLGANHPMGPLELADFIGLDTCLAIMEVLHDGFGDSKYRPCPLLKQYVAAGWLGKKSGRGFYTYA
jgi:3-hydroxybutyryl-CoA dehydrogenase